MWDALEHEVQTRGLPERAIPVLSEAALGLKVRNATYRTSADISENLASRDLKLLTNAGLLVPEGEKRGRYYVCSDTLRTIGLAAASGEAKGIADPFV